MKVRAVLFDLDETLIEEESSNDASALAAGAIAAARHGVDPVALLAALRARSLELWLDGPMLEYCRDIGISAREGLWGSFSGDAPALTLLQLWISDYRLQAWSAALLDAGVRDTALAAELAEFFARDRRERHVVFPESVRVLEALQKRFRLAMITNGAPDIQYEKIRGSKLGHFFEHTIVSGDVGFGKPNPKIFHLMLEQLGVAPIDAVMIGDSLHRDIGGAREAGVRTIWVNRIGKIIESRHPKPDLQLADLSELSLLLIDAD